MYAFPPPRKEGKNKLEIDIKSPHNIKHQNKCIGRARIMRVAQMTLLHIFSAKSRQNVGLCKAMRAIKLCFQLVNKEFLDLIYATKM